MKFLLDTDTCIYALKHEPLVREAMTATARADIALSVITECELRLGAAKSARPEETLALLENFLRPIRTLEYTSDDAKRYARVRASLEKAGTPIGPLDTLIGSHALSRELTLVTHNSREFSRIPALELTDWQTPAP